MHRPTRLLHSYGVSVRASSQGEPGGADRKSSEKAHRANWAGWALIGQYRIQIEGGLQGALRWTMYGAAVVTLAHFTWPLFR